MTYRSSPARVTSPYTKVPQRLPLMPILEIQRPHNSETEWNFANAYIIALKRFGYEVWQDKIGNFFIEVPSPEGTPRVLWSCHIDTIHREEGKQKVVSRVVAHDATKELTTFLHLEDWKEKRYGMCLGADDGVGVWMMLNMVLGKVPGLYIFHRGEEKGCLGSKAIASNKTVQDQFRITECAAAIALDRKGTDNVITHQMERRLASDEFAKSINACMGVDFWRPDPTGMYTDTHQYGDLIGECTNLSIGYMDNHTSAEIVNYTFANAMLDRLLKFDATKLVIKRKAGEKEATVLWNNTNNTASGDRVIYGKSGYWEGGVYTPYDSDVNKVSRDPDESDSKLVQLPHCKEQYKKQKQGRGGTFSDRFTRFLNKYPRLFAEACIKAGWTEEDVQAIMYNHTKNVHEIDG